MKARPKVTAPLAWDNPNLADEIGWGALYTIGWGRQVYSIGHPAKVTKQIINHKRIYPPRTATREDLLAAAV